MNETHSARSNFYFEILVYMRRTTLIILTFTTVKELMKVIEIHGGMQQLPVLLYKLLMSLQQFKLSRYPDLTRSYSCSQ